MTNESLTFNNRIEEVRFWAGFGYKDHIDYELCEETHDLEISQGNA